MLKPIIGIIIICAVLIIQFVLISKTKGQKNHINNAKEYDTPAD